MEFVFRTFKHPLLELFFLNRGKHFVCLGRGHHFVFFGAVNSLDDRAFFYAACNDGAKLDGIFALV